MRRALTSLLDVVRRASRVFAAIAKTHDDAMDGIIARRGGNRDTAVAPPNLSLYHSLYAVARGKRFAKVQKAKAHADAVPVIAANPHHSINSPR